MKLMIVQMTDDQDCRELDDDFQNRRKKGT